jgi:hypothetical protein
MKRLVFASILFLMGSTAWAAPPDWAGHWEFAECWPHLDTKTHNCIEYSMKVRRTEAGYAVDIDMDGFQTMRRLSGEGRINRNVLEILFRAAREEDMGSRFKPGDLLLILKRQNGKVLTEWHEIEPALDKYKKPGIYFRQKISGSTRHRP